MRVPVSARRHLTIHWATPSWPGDPASFQGSDGVSPQPRFQALPNPGDMQGASLPGPLVTSDFRQGSGCLLGALAPVPHPAPLGLRACPSPQHTFPGLFPVFLCLALPAQTYFITSSRPAEVDVVLPSERSAVI